MVDLKIKIKPDRGATQVVKVEDPSRTVVVKFGEAGTRPATGGVAEHAFTAAYAPQGRISQRLALGRD